MPDLMVDLTESISTRPKLFDAFVGNANVVERLKYAVKSAQIQNKILPHILLYGNPGLGKTTLANIIAKETGAGLYECTGSTITNQLELFKVLIQVDAIINSGKPAILFIDEIHDILNSGLPETVWYPILEDFKFMHNLKDRIFKCGGRKLLVGTETAILKPFTVIGATTEPGNLIDALRDRFPIQCVLESYNIKDLEHIIRLHAEMRRIKIDDEAVNAIAVRSRSNARTAINFLLKCNDIAIVEA